MPLPEKNHGLHEKKNNILQNTWKPENKSSEKKRKAQYDFSPHYRKKNKEFFWTLLEPQKTKIILNPFQSETYKNIIHLLLLKTALDVASRLKALDKLPGDVATLTILWHFEKTCFCHNPIIYVVPCKFSERWVYKETINRKIFG